MFENIFCSEKERMESKTNQSLTEMRMGDMKKTQSNVSVMGSQLNSINLTENENETENKTNLKLILAKFKKFRLFYILSLAIISTLSIT